MSCIFLPFVLILIIIANHVWIKFEAQAVVLLKPCSVNESFQNAPAGPRHILRGPPQSADHSLGTTVLINQLVTAFRCTKSLSDRLLYDQDSQNILSYSKLVYQLINFFTLILIYQFLKDGGLSLPRWSSVASTVFKAQAVATLG